MTFNQVTVEFPNIFVYGFCPGYEVPVQVMKCLYRLWSACTGFEVPVQVMKCLYRLWSACTGYEVPVQVMKCLYRLWSACTGYEVPVLNETKLVFTLPHLNPSV